MPARKLIERLNREADEQAKAIREEAEAEVERVRDEAKRRAKALSRKYRERESEAVGEKTAEITAAAERESGQARREAEAALVSRLSELAFASLSGLRKDGYDAVFRSLAAEVPALGWKTVRVNPVDSSLAGAVFPGADVQGEETITGGLEVASEDGRVKIVNTFEKRLERAWEEIIPGLLKEAYEKHPGD